MDSAGPDHWNRVYTNKEPDEVSWYQAEQEISLRLIAAAGVRSDEPILDAGGGAATLVDSLQARGFTDITVLDISAAALARTRARLGARGEAVDWIVNDVTTFSPQRQYALWHDRAVFHFLVDPRNRDRYVDTILAALQPRGHLVLATFGPDGPLRCSGLATRRYGIDELHALFDQYFDLHGHELHDHVTPAGSSQQFIYSRWQLKSQ